MPGGWNSYAQAVVTDGPLGWYRFNELLAGSAVTAGSQDPQNLCLDSSSPTAQLPATSSNSVSGFGNISLTGTWVGGTDTITPVIGGVSHQYNTVAGDTTLTTFAINLAANINTQFAGTVTAAAQGTQVNINAVATGAASNLTLTVTVSSASGLATASGATLTGGATFTQASSAGGGPVLPHGSVLQYGSAVLSNQPSLLSTDGNVGTVLAGDSGGAAVFPSTATKSLINIVTGGSATPAILQPTLAITVAAWCKPAVIVGGATQILVCYGSDAATLAAYNLNHTGSSAVNHTYVFSINIGGALKTATATLPVLVAGTTAHVVGTYDGANVRIFVNGVLRGTTAATGPISYASIASLGLAFGNDPSLTDGNLQGTLDEVAIYSQALSATRIAYHFRQGSTYLPFVWNH